MSVALFKQLGPQQSVTLAATWNATPLTFNASGTGSFRVHNSGTKDAQVCLADDLATATSPGNFYFTLAPNETEVIRGFNGPIYCNAQSSGAGTGTVEFVPGA